MVTSGMQITFDNGAVLVTPQNADVGASASRFAGVVRGRHQHTAALGMLTNWQRDAALLPRYTSSHNGDVGFCGLAPLNVEGKLTMRQVFFRDSKSLELAQQLGASSPVMEFGPDGAFACDLRDAEKAEAFLKTNRLEPGKYLCCIPRLRYTPYWTIKESAKFDAVKHARNEKMKHHDHQPLFDAIVQVVTQTDKKILICPEDRTQMTVGKELLYDQLPESLLDRVVWKPDYWLTGEAISVYIRSAGLFGNEMHSPIMCIGHGIPAVVCRFDEQTSKGYMWEDIGLSDWLFDHDSPEDQQRIASTVVDIAMHPKAAKAKALDAKRLVEHRQLQTMDLLRDQLPA